MAARDFRIFGGDAHMAPSCGIITADILGRRSDDEAAVSYTKVERRINLGILEFHQHIVAGDAEMRRAKRDEIGDVEIAHANDLEASVVRGEAELPRLVIGKRALDLDPGTAKERHDLAEDAPFGKRE